VSDPYKIATVRFSYQLLPEQPTEALLDVIALLDELGFWACYSADETYHKDMCRSSRPPLRARPESEWGPR
jgi:hypothetical protein